LPGIEVTIQVAQIPVVLEAFLELVGCEQMKQVTCFRPFRQVFETPIPAGAIEGIVGNKLVKKLARLDVVDRPVQAVRFFVERLDSIQVTFR
jgi:hypothetical protein